MRRRRVRVRFLCLSCSSSKRVFLRSAGRRPSFFISFLAFFAAARSLFFCCFFSCLKTRWHDQHQAAHTEKTQQRCQSHRGVRT